MIMITLLHIKIEDREKLSPRYTSGKPLLFLGVFLPHQGFFLRLKSTWAHTGGAFQDGGGDHASSGQYPENGKGADLDDIEELGAGLFVLALSHNSRGRVIMTTYSLLFELFEFFEC